MIQETADIIAVLCLQIAAIYAVMRILIHEATRVSDQCFLSRFERFDERTRAELIEFFKKRNEQ